MRHIQAINEKSHRQELALREAEWHRQQAEERAKSARPNLPCMRNCKRSPPN